LDELGDSHRLRSRGKVWLGYNSPAWLKERHGIRGMDDAIAGLEKALDAMIGKALE
jgi:hypothetical protein